jgi:hypothetical protein
MGNENWYAGKKFKKKIIYRNTEQTANMDNKCILHVRFQTSGRLLKQHQLLAEAEVNKVQ